MWYRKFYAQCHNQNKNPGLFRTNSNPITYKRLGNPERRLFQQLPTCWFHSSQTDFNWYVHHPPRVMKMISTLFFFLSQVYSLVHLSMSAGDEQINLHSLCLIQPFQENKGRDICMYRLTLAGKQRESGHHHPYTSIPNSPFATYCKTHIRLSQDYFH